MLYPLRLLSTLHRLIGRRLTIPQHLIYRKMCNGMDTMEVVHYVASFRPLPVRWMGSRVTVPQSIAAEGLTYVVLERDRLLPPVPAAPAGPPAGRPAGDLPRRLPPSHAPETGPSGGNYPQCGPRSLTRADPLRPTPPGISHKTRAFCVTAQKCPNAIIEFQPKNLTERTTRCALDDREFIQRVKEKIERLTGQEIDLEIDYDNESRMTLELEHRRCPGSSSALTSCSTPGSVVSPSNTPSRPSKRGAEVSQLEFQALLSRN